MKTIYFLSNNLMSPTNIIYPKETTFNEARAKTPLSTKGEEVAKNLQFQKELEHIEAIYSSPYISAVNTSKYIAEAKKLDIILDNRLKERTVGQLGCNEYRYLKGMQEHDFTFKLEQGESLTEVKERMVSFVKEILMSDDNEILVVTHATALTSLFLCWCEKGYSLEDHLILSYHDEILFDGSFNDINLFKVEFNDQNVKNISIIKDKI